MLKQADVAADQRRRQLLRRVCFLVLNDIAGKESAGEIGSLHAKTPVFLPKSHPWPDVEPSSRPALTSALDLAEQPAHPIRPLLPVAPPDK